MVSQIQPSEADIIYPESDGQPMADNTKQFRWILTIQQNIAWMLIDQADMFVAGDLLWYPVRGSLLSTAPDVMVAFGRPKGDRGSYKQWEEGDVAPQVVFEILSPRNTRAEMNRKLLFYNQYGVEEYYLYDPETNELSGWQRRDDFLEVIDPIDHWSSPRLGIRFDLIDPEMRIVYPDGKPFLTYAEIAAQLEQVQQQVEQAQQQARQAQQQAEQAQQRAERLAAQLRALGLEPDA